jgi:hypothetical protein
MESNEYSWEIFLAHAGADKAAAEDLYNLLSKHCRVFLDTHCLVLGDDWDRKLASAQRKSLVTVVLVSSRTEQAYYQREEIAAAIHMARKDENKHRVVPIFLDDVPDEFEIHYGLRLKHGLHLSQVKGWSEIAQRLLTLIEYMHQELGIESQQQCVLGIKPSGASVRFELKSKQVFDERETDYLINLHLVNEALLRYTGRRGICILGYEGNPHRVYVEASLEVYDKFNKGLLSGELDEATQIHWSGIRNLTAEHTGKRPEMTPIIFCEDYEENFEGRSVVCFRGTIEGCYAEAKQAEQFVGDLTSNPADCRVYLTKVRLHNIDFLYIQSNFVQQERGYPTKIATEAKVSLFTLLQNILFSDLPSDQELESVRLLHRTKVQYFVNERMIPKGDPTFYCGAMNIEFVSIT